MTATVIDLASRRATRDDCCPRHRIESLLARVAARADDARGELLIPATALLDLADDVSRTIAASLDERPTGKTNP